jgi:uncharacterized protein
MSDLQNAALIQSLYDAFASGDIAHIVSHLAADVDWVVEGPAVIPYAGRRKGPEQVRESFFGPLATGETNRKLTMQPLIAQGDRVAGIGRYTATVIATGKTYDTAVAHFFTVRDGKVAKLHEVLDSADIADAYRGATTMRRV